MPARKTRYLRYTFSLAAPRQQVAPQSRRTKVIKLRSRFLPSILQRSIRRSFGKRLYPLISGQRRYRFFGVPSSAITKKGFFIVSRYRALLSLRACKQQRFYRRLIRDYFRQFYRRKRRTHLRGRRLKRLRRRPTHVRASRRVRATSRLGANRMFTILRRPPAYFRSLNRLFNSVQYLSSPSSASRVYYRRGIQSFIRSFRESYYTPS
jgi:hypothetical protein